MPDWLVKLEGEEHDLRTVAQLLCATDLRVDQETDGYYLHAAALKGLDDQDEVRRRARQILRWASAAELVRCGSSLPITFTEVVQIEADGNRRPLREFKFTHTWNVRVPHTSVSASDPPMVASWMALAEQDRHVRRLLEIYSRPERDWYDLFTRSR